MMRTVESVLSIVSPSRCLLLGRGAGEGKAPPPAFEWASLGIYHLSELRGALFDTTAHFFRREGAASATPRIREVGFQTEDFSAPVRLFCCVADVRETTASLFAKTRDVRRQAIASPDAGQRERSKWSIHP